MAGRAFGARSGRQYRSSRVVPPSIVSVWPGGSLRNAWKNVRSGEWKPILVKYAATVASSSSPETPGAARAASTVLAKMKRFGVRA